MDINDLKGDAPVITLADITGRFGTRTQRQDYYETKEEQQTAEQQKFVRDPLYDPAQETTASDYSGIYEDEEQLERMISPERARRTGKRIAQVIDIGFNFVASNFIAHSDKDYKANPSDLEDIAEAWGEIAEEKQWEVSPYMSLMVLYAIVYAPLAKQAFNDRRLAVVETRQDTLEDEIKALKNELARRDSAKA
ncbi:MAG: hypothetical protein UHK44_07695 [Bacteroidaceae bacterium]|nr:hypothetical protein [Bacteroidaceae bacterium]